MPQEKPEPQDEAAEDHMMLWISALFIVVVSSALALWPGTVA